MREAGQRQIDAAKEDGRWDAAYDSASTMTMPDDFQAALDANPAAKAFWETLNKTNRLRHAGPDSDGEEAGDAPATDREVCCDVCGG